jgi:hypothetical protein
MSSSAPTKAVQPLAQQKNFLIFFFLGDNFGCLDQDQDAKSGFGYTNPTQSGPNPESVLKH